MKVKVDTKGFPAAEKRLSRAGLDVVRGAAAEMQGGWQSRVRVDTGVSRRQIVIVPTSDGARVVGESDVLVFHEFGTGRYAEGGGGRQDPWVYQDRNGNWWTTIGVTPNPAARPAFDEAVAYFHKEKKRRGL